MCGCKSQDQNPRQLTVLGGETVMARTLRLLRETGVTDIALSTNHPAFKQFGLPILKHENKYKEGGMWVDGFYPMNEPVCYIFGDVVFSPEAIKKIVETDTDDIEFFASAPPFAENYIKPYAEAFAFKVHNTEHFHQAIQQTKELRKWFYRDPLPWELWQVIKETPLNRINYKNFVVINDYTCDIDKPEDVGLFEERVFSNL